MTSGSLWNYLREEIVDVDNNASDGKSFKYKTKNSRKNTAKTSITRSRSRCKLKTATISTIFNCCSYYPNQIS